MVRIKRASQPSQTAEWRTASGDAAWTLSQAFRLSAVAVCELLGLDPGSPLQWLKVDHYGHTRAHVMVGTLGRHVGSVSLEWDVVTLEAG